MLGMFDIKLGTFVALGVRGSGMIENCSFNLGEFYVKMGKTNYNLYMLEFIGWIIDKIYTN